MKPLTVKLLVKCLESDKYESTIVPNVVIADTFDLRRDVTIELTSDYICINKRMVDGDGYKIYLTIDELIEIANGVCSCERTSSEMFRANPELIKGLEIPEVNNDNP